MIRKKKLEFQDPERVLDKSLRCAEETLRNYLKLGSSGRRKDSSITDDEKPYDEYFPVTLKT